MQSAAEKLAEPRTMAVNVNAGGKVHRLSKSSAAQPREKKRAHCGWWAGAAVAKTMFCKRADAGSFCRKCFGSAAAKPCDDELDEVSEEFD